MTDPTDKSFRETRSLDGRIDLLCDRFEAAWKSGRQPEIEEYLVGLEQQAPPQLEADASTDDRLKLFQELLRLELHYRSQSDQQLTSREYGSRFPIYAREVEDIFESLDQPQSAGEAGQEAAALDETVNLGSDTRGFGKRPSEPGKAATSLPVGPRFEIVRPHAKGGLGEIFVARDRELNREVALKEIRREHADSADSRSRFLLEAEVTGGLEHPGIVPVYGLGHYPDGRPYYAMRFIGGDSLQKAIEHYHTSHPDGDNSADRTLELRQLLGRFINVCNAIQYAHSRGVLHRDLKPDNVMLGKFGETLVVDWGLAKARGGTDEDPENDGGLRPALSNVSETQYGSAIGTPAFMSPEQASGQLDQLGPPSDVYSLGATLYNVLAGRPPVTGKDLSATLRKVQDGDFPPPRQVRKDTPAALAAISLAAMRNAPTERYASPQELAEDVERWLADEPVAAYRDKLPARLARWGRRHQTIVASVAVLLISAVIGLSVGAVLLGDANRRIEQQRDVARTNRAKAESQRKLADQNFHKAWDAVDTYLRQVATDRRLREQALEPLRRDLLLAARKFFDEFVQQKGDEHRLQLDRGRAYIQLAKITNAVGSKKEVVGLFEQAVAIFEAENKREPGSCQRLLTNARRSWGGALIQLNDFEAAERELNKARDETLQVEENRRGGQWALEAAMVSVDLGWLYSRTRRLEEAEQQFTLALERLRTAESVQSTAFESLTTEVMLAKGQNVLGAVYRRTGRPVKAHTAHSAARAQLEKLVRLEPRNSAYRRDLVNSLLGLANATTSIAFKEKSSLGSAENVRRLHQRAAEEYALAEQQVQRLSEDHPDVIVHQNMSAIVAYNIGNRREDVEEFKSAEQAFLRAGSRWEKLRKQHPEDPNYTMRLGITYAHLADVIREQGRKRESIGWYEKAQTALRATMTQNPAAINAQFHLISTHSGLGRAAALTGDHARAAREAEALAKSGGGHSMADLVFDAVRILAAAYTAVAEDKSLDKKTRKATTDKYGARALKMLEQCVELNYFRDSFARNLLRNSNELQPLRSQPEFAKLFETIDKQAQ